MIIIIINQSSNEPLCFCVVCVEFRIIVVAVVVYICKIKLCILALPSLILFTVYILVCVTFVCCARLYTYCSPNHTYSMRLLKLNAFTLLNFSSLWYKIVVKPRKRYVFIWIYLVRELYSERRRKWNKLEWCEYS